MVAAKGRPITLALLVGLAFPMGCKRSEPPSPPPSVDAGASEASQTSAIPVVVAIVIDQEAAWIASVRWPLLPADGGFARLRREGTYVREMRYAHSVTDTAPGHSALYTGAPPRVSGIWGNEVLDPTSYEKVSILRDSGTKMVWSNAPPAFVGSSTGPLAVDTVADRFRIKNPDAIIVSLSLKDRGAIFAGGRKPTASLWYDKDLDRFVTSTAFSSTFPAWATPDLAVPKDARATPWTLLDPKWVEEHAATPDDQPGEGTLGGMPIVFPHDVAHAASPASAFRASPDADDALFALAIAALDGEKVRAHPSLLALSLSANDYVGHTFGPDSWEAWDELRRLDASLARFFGELDTRFGSDGWSVILSADHGVTTMPEAALLPQTRPWCGAHGGDASTDRWDRACGNVGRLMPDLVTTELREVAAKVMPGSTEPMVAGVVDPYVYLTTPARGLGTIDLAKLKAALTTALLRHPEVDRVIDTTTLPETCPTESDESVDALVCRSYVPGHSGDLYVVVRRGSFFDPDLVPGKGSSHGSPYLFDRAVPLLVRAPGRAAAGKVVDGPVSFRAFSRALSTLLGVEPPNFEATRAPDFAKPR
jgi:hypothetical protein